MATMRELSAAQRRIAEMFKYRFDKDGWSYAQLVDELKNGGTEASVSGLQKMLTAQRGISMEMAMRLSDVLGVPWIDLYEPQQSDDPTSQVKSMLEYLQHRIAASIEHIKLADRETGGLGYSLMQVERVVDENWDAILPEEFRDGVFAITDEFGGRKMIQYSAQMREVWIALDGLQLDIANALRLLREGD
ncbi:hypothetical protein HMPREF2714_07415 [Corynebacterium sp. HMSC077G01]|nr:hypothetical protein HMPREF2714_07415 [Corynebacterium sp. HMSC077G01]